MENIVMEQSFNSDSYERNYKGTDNIILLAIGPQYEF